VYFGLVSAYFYIYLLFNPDDPGKKEFYSKTTLSPGYFIGYDYFPGREIPSNLNKSYLLHLIGEYFENFSKRLYILGCLIYFFFLYIFGMFKKREELSKDICEELDLYKIKILSELDKYLSVDEPETEKKDN
jgi:hypothetical protein